VGEGGRVLDAAAYKLPAEWGGHWRMRLRVQRDQPQQPLELRAYLRHAGGALTETWAALLPPEHTQDPTRKPAATPSDAALHTPATAMRQEDSPR
jgi:glucan biosynthesis protein